MFDLPDIEKYWIAFGMLFASCFGAPIPEEAVVVYGGVQVGLAWPNPHSTLYWGIMLPMLIVSIVVLDGMLYFIGRTWGEKLLRKPWIERNILPHKKRKQIEANFHEYGISILLFARLLPMARMPIFMMSGMMKLPVRKFLFADLIYAIPGVSILFALGYWLGDSFNEWLHRVKHDPAFLIGTLVVAGIALFIFIRYKREIATGDPHDVPVIGDQLAHMAHHEHPEEKQPEAEKPEVPLPVPESPLPEPVKSPVPSGE
jgi:membrane protein DedA with SNARE-associated domain